MNDSIDLNELENNNLPKNIFSLEENESFDQAKREKYSDVTKVFFLSGLYEVGRNCYCIEHENEILVFDVGIRLPDATIAVDAIIPNFSYLKETKKDVYLVITHGHEDHIGAINYFLKDIRPKTIYAPKFALELINLKVKDVYHKTLNTFCDKVIEIIHGLTYKTNHFSFKYFRVNHSIPDAHGIVIKTVNGTIVTTGDFKFDFSPVTNFADYYDIAKAGKEKVDLLLSDSTNAMVQGFTKSEKDISQTIEKIFTQIKNRIIISTFASNIWRINEILKVAEKYKKKVIILGRSIEKMINVAIKLKIITVSKNLIVPVTNINLIDKSTQVIICTGSQGEPLSALKRISEDEHRQIILDKTDTVIFSSNPIPGNFLSVQEIINDLVQRGINVITNSSISGGVSLHTSGHASKEEQKLMLNLIQPNYFVPMHGEYFMLCKHRDTAIECKVKKENIFVVKNGVVVGLKNKKCMVLPDISIDTEANFVYNGEIISVNDSSINKRKKIGSSGVIINSILIDIEKKKVNENYLNIIFLGIIKNNIKKIKNNLLYTINELLKNEENWKNIDKLTNLIKKYAKIATKKAFYQIETIDPYILTDVIFY
ncbi:ribonuclease J [symbiont of Argiope bruennichi]|uniref:ribonuclease J n=1 Tax=symbiont of Argiope bruennichi TaxID=2810479 RepID=UPI003DA60DAA